MNDHVATVSSICPACGACGENTVRDVHDHEYALPRVTSYAACVLCGTCFQTPMPAEHQLASFYPVDYHSMKSGGLLTRIRNDMRLRGLLGLLGDRSGAVLDYGCGDGSFLLHAAERLPSRRFFGYELDGTRKVDHLASGRVTIVRGSLADLLDMLSPCALVSMNHVIEHLPDPLAVLSAIHARLVPDGVFEGQTPAASSLEHKVFGPRWSGYHAPRHTVVFSRPGLHALLKRAGFVDLQVHGAFNPAGIAVSLASLTQRRDAPGRIKRSGPAWLAWLGLSTALAPFDVWSASPGIVNFSAKRG